MDYSLALVLINCTSRHNRDQNCCSIFNDCYDRTGTEQGTIHFIYDHTGSHSFSTNRIISLYCGKWEQFSDKVIAIL